MKRALAVIMLLCLLLSAGCSESGQPGIKADEKPIEVKEATLGSTEVSYAAKGLSGFGDLNYDGFSPVPIIDGNIYLLGGKEGEYYIYRAGLDGSDPSVIVSREGVEDGEEIWRAMTSFNGKLYLSVDICLTDALELREFDTSGNLLRTIALPDDTWSLPILVGGEKYIYAFDSGKGRLIAIDPDSEEHVAFTIETAQLATLGKLADGRVVIGTFEDKGTRKSLIDEENRCLGEGRYLDISCSLQGSGGDWSIYLQSGNDIYGFDFDSAKMEKLFSLSSLGLRYNGALHDCRNGTFISTVSLAGFMDKPTLIYKVEIPADAKPLTLATVGELDYDTQGIILSWNAQHPECRVEVKDYSVYNTESDLSLAQQKLAADIGTGEIPDMYNLSIGDAALNTPVLVRRGLLEDLYPYLDADAEIDRSDFLPGPLKAMELNGGLYQAASSFILFTTVGAAADVGSPEEWTYAGLEQKIAENEKYRRLMDGKYSTEEWLRMTVEASGARLVDWEKGECHFDSPYFIHLLELAAEMEDIDFGGTTSMSKVLEESKALLLSMTSFTVMEGEIGPQLYGDGNYAFVGYPEIGAVVYPKSSVGISAYSENKEQCWQFVREYFLKSSVNGISLRYDGVWAQYQQECGSEFITEGKKQAMRDFIAHAENASVCYRQDETLWAMIKAELNRFLAGKNTAEQTADAIQAKASIYIAEQN